jgi:predicted dehydrogenase
MNKQAISRRRFLLGAAAASTAYSLFPSRAYGANERVNLGIIGLGDRGGAHFKAFSQIREVEIVAVSDADANRMGKAGDKAAKHQDFRRLLEMKDVDAVIIAAPDHWHCLAAILAFQAGKHAYVEKPVSHCIWEGRKMVEAARKYKRIVQAGTQQRSCPAVQHCAADIQSGVYGKPLWAHCSRLSAREPIGKVTGPQPVPEGVDYNLWAGPAPMAPIMRTNFHYDWHWQWDWGTGEMGNWGVHYLDDLRHLLGWNDVPNNVMAAGNRWCDDDGETPNMHIALMEHQGMKIVIDVRNMAGDSSGSRCPEYLGGNGGNYIMCENGFVRIARGKGKGFDKDGKEVKEYKGTGGTAHYFNFIKALREDSSASLACEIEVGHLSTTLCHMANIGFRVGKATPVEELRDSVKTNEDAANTLSAMLEQLGKNQVDLKAKPFIAGPRLTYDTKAETFTGDRAEEANKFVRIPGRDPFNVPENV